MRIIEQTAKRFHGTHKGYEISIWLDEDDLDEDEVPRFYIQVWSMRTGGHNYDGWAPESIRTIAQAKKEAIRGSCIDMPKEWWANLGKPSAEVSP